MPRVNRVTKAAKAQGHCGRCHVEIKAGDPYVWWKFRFGGKHRRCTKPACQPRPSDLTSSPIRSALYAAQEAVQDQLEEIGPDTDFESIRDGMAEAIREQIDELQEKLDNIESGMGHTGFPIYEEIDERREALEYWADEVENVDVDFDADEFVADEDADEEEIEDLKEQMQTRLEEIRDELQGAVDSCPE